ncbi:MAG: 4Fe-4S binding protein [Moorella humiferrea]|nr:4Fe-4S binding protein [Moorella humiferrea]
MIIDKEKCIGCGVCLKYCTVQAISLLDKVAVVDPERCTECYVCLRKNVCKQKAIMPNELHNFCKVFQHILSDPVETIAGTGVTGRGTEESKTNDVTGRVKKGDVGICIDMGRPGIGVYLRDAEKVAMACARAGVEFLGPNETPLAQIMSDIKTGKFRDECLDYHLLSVIIEGKCKESDLPAVLRALQKVEKEINTVFSLGIMVRVDEDGQTKALDCLEELGIPQPVRGKVNVGLGRPLSLD